MTYGPSELVIDPVLVRKYNVTGPGYTSYPTADRFVEAFNEATYRYWLSSRNIGGIITPLSLYIHVPFCSTGCFHGACNKRVTRNRSRAVQYVRYLEREVNLTAGLLDENRRVTQIHWGGGTPTYLARDDIQAMCKALDGSFDIAADCEYSIEIDPREIQPGTIAFLGDLGFNRVSIGVQDFDPAVQKAVHRIQSEETVHRVTLEARAAEFRSISFDLIYGLPRQSLDSFNATLDSVLALDPDRIALYSYAHLPDKFPAQRRIAESGLPSAETKLQILTLAIGRLTGAGYVYIGMDHFAKPGDELSVAQRQGRLHRNFQGYSTRPDCDMLAFGTSAVSRVGPSYSQNVRDTTDYYAALDEAHLPVRTGVVLSKDDLLRRAVIQALLCQFRLSIESIETAYLVSFASYFSKELEDLKVLEEDGLVEIQPQWIVVTPKGRMLVRIACMVFDRYLREGSRWAGYSKVL
ncbi:MAG: oxygen-independent coproporphyrinogen III oxidase [Burkholderiales bacterium]|jgi:oxygen-independent coproporphyrinogen-3 oxidase